MSRRRDTLVLSPDQHLMLSQHLEDRAAGAASRARVLQCWDAGLSGAETARRLGLPESRVYALRRAFRRQGLAAYLRGSDPGGAPTKLTAEVLGELACLSAQQPVRPWSLRRLASHLVSRGLVESISAVTVAKALSQLETAAA